MQIETMDKILRTAVEEIIKVMQNKDFPIIIFLISLTKTVYLMTFLLSR